MLKIRKYALFQGVERLTPKHNSVREQIKGLLNETYETEDEMLETMKAEVCEGTFFEFSYDGQGVETSYTFDLSCDNYLEDVKKMTDDYYKYKAHFSKGLQNG